MHLEFKDLFDSIQFDGCYVLKGRQRKPPGCGIAMTVEARGQAARAQHARPPSLPAYTGSAKSSPERGTRDSKLGFILVSLLGILQTFNETEGCAPYLNNEWATI